MLTLNEINYLDANKCSATIHKQFVHIKNYCNEEKINECNAKNVTSEARWVEIFEFLHGENIRFETFALLIEFILALPGTTAVVERIFVGMNKYQKKKPNYKSTL